MGAKKFSLEFTGQPVSPSPGIINTIYGFGLKIVYDNNLVYDIVRYFRFNGTSSGNAIRVQGTLAETVQETADSLQTVFENDVELTIVGDTIEMIFGNNLIDVQGVWVYTTTEASSYTYAWGIGTQEEYTFENPETITFNDAIVLSRSPYWFRYSPGVAYDRMVLRLYIYTGHKVDDKPASPTYTLSKYVVQAGQPTIGFDIAQLLNDRVQNSITTIGQEGSFSVDFKDTVWCYAEADVYLADDLLFTIEQQILAVDGFGYHTELINPEIPTPILTSNTHHVIYNNEDYPIYFLTDALDDIEVNGQTITFAYDTNLSTQNIGYINLAAYHDGDASFTAVFTYGEDVYTHTVERRVECRYDVLNCLFKNKYGFWQSMAFSKLSKNDYSRTSQNYQKVISNFGQYSLSSHSKRDYLTSLSQKITANTDFLPESQNELIKELLLSEFVYLKVDGVLLPVNITSNSWAEKTSHINKLIQYTMEFTISHDLMNNVK